jgi:DNA adenine methylase
LQPLPTSWSANSARTTESVEPLGQKRLAFKLSPPLKWAGGKRWLVPHLRPLWAEHLNRRLVEPLCGGLAVTLGLKPERALLNDINPHAINFYRWVARGLKTALPMANSETKYYRYRNRFNRLVTAGREESQEAAELFYYLNRTGYNGLCRFNHKGEFNVPFGKYKRIYYAEDFSGYQAALASWEFRSCDFQQVPLQPEDFVYADPPYDVEFTKYSKEDFTWDDQVRLATWLAAHLGPVVLSNQATDRVVRLYRELDYEVQFLDAPRRISCTGDRTPAREVLAMKGVSRNAPS